MGEGKERQPLAIISDAPIEFTNRRVGPKDVAIDIKEDLYKPLLRPIIRKLR
jgi:hypothetical protein